MTSSDSLRHLAATVLSNLKYEHGWTQVTVHSRSPASDTSMERPLISGLPPRRLYLHPDEQDEMVAAERHGGVMPAAARLPEREWVMPVYLAERCTLATFAAVMGALPSRAGRAPASSSSSEVAAHGGRNFEETKRVVLAAVHDDSTVAYYLMHDGIVKPRQN